MAKIVELPRLSDTMEEGVVAKWLIAVGDKVKRGQVIAEIETDKATMEFESFDAGIVLKLVAPEGETLPLGAPIAVLGKKGEDAEAALAAAPSANASTPAPAEAGTATPSAPVSAAPSPATPTAARAGRDDAPGKDDGRVAASPLARRLAREAGLELATISGTGPHGRVVKTDVEAAASTGGAGAGSHAVPAGQATSTLDANGRPYASRPDTTVKLTQLRKTIAKRMSQANAEAPHFYLTMAIDMTAAVGVRAEVNASLEQGKVSFNDLVVMATAKALRQHPEINAYYTPQGIVQRGDVHVGVAVAIEDGLIVPVIRYADQKSLSAIAAEVRALAKKGLDRKLHPDEMTGSSFTVSNLGMFGIDEFSAVVNPGEGAILAVGGINDTLVPVDGAPVVRKIMKVTLSCDHRCIDGAMGAKFLQTLQAMLEQPMRLFA